MVKMVIVVRKDLHMRSGKMAAQVAHSAMKVWFDRMTEIVHPDDFSKQYVLKKEDLTSEMIEWKETAFTKVVVGVDNEEEIYALAEKAKEADIPYAIMIDNGMTEFAGNKTTTCIAIGPAEVDDIDPNNRSPKINVKPWLVCNPYNVNYNLQDLFNNLKYNTSNEITKQELSNMFGYELFYIDIENVSGYCSSKNKELIISTHWGEKEDLINETFCHEFSHILQDASNDHTMDTLWPHGNLTFSQALKKEQEAVNLSIQVWNWLYPKKKLPKNIINYYSKDDYIWFKDYTKDFFEYDAKEFENDIFRFNKTFTRS